MKRSHKILFENLLQEEYNRGYNDCRKAVTQNLRVKTETGEIRRAPTPKGQTRRNLLSVMRTNYMPTHTRGWTELVNKAYNSSLSEGAISGVLSRMKKEGLVEFTEFGWQIRQESTEKEARLATEALNNV